jgi:hypothetical protein
MKGNFETKFHNLVFAAFCIISGFLLKNEAFVMITDLRGTQSSGRHLNEQQFVSQSKKYQIPVLDFLGKKSKDVSFTLKKSKIFSFLSSKKRKAT